MTKDAPLDAGLVGQPALDLGAARALAKANRKAGFPVPPLAQAVIDAADAKPAAKPAPTKTPAAEPLAGQ